MKILRETLRLILSQTPMVPPETGGILGGKNQIVFSCVFDNGSGASDKSDIYVPNIQWLNQTIGEWEKVDIEFYGIFHSHFPGGTALSNGDKRYIMDIMNAMPKKVSRLYFPLVFPRECIIVYRADRLGHSVRIVSDQIEEF